MHPKIGQKLVYENRSLKKEVGKWKLIAFCLGALALVLIVKDARAGEFSTVTLCSREMAPTSIPGKERLVEQWRRKEMAKQEICSAVPIAKVPYGLKYTTKEWEFKFTLQLRR